MLCEGLSIEQLLVSFLHQVMMKVNDQGPSRGLVPCGPPSAEANETVSMTLHYIKVHPISYSLST